jgi:hypothetical protein
MCRIALLQNDRDEIVGIVRQQLRQTLELVQPAETMP